MDPFLKQQGEFTEALYSPNGIHPAFDISGCGLHEACENYSMG
jgi:hypothetical protein